VLPKQGVAVLRYDRRTPPEDRDVAFQTQLDDLDQAVRVMANELGPVPIGLWGFSQGAWICLLAAAADPTLAFVILVGCSAVSPAQQMRYGTAEQLRRAGFGSEALSELAQLRSAWEQFERGQLLRDEAQRVIDEFTGRPWSYLSWVPNPLPAEPSSTDMDFDPGEVISRLRCPVLAFYGNDEWVPVAESKDVWRSRCFDSRQLTIHDLPGTTHYPTLGGGRTVAAISPEYATSLTTWLGDLLATVSRPRGE
jgi:pimeloyl-ACP methyl ester carboxylesterase